MFGRIAVFLYGVFCYVVSLATFLFAAAFIGNFAVTKSLDSGVQSSFLRALAINAALVALFGLQHSVMARPWFKAAWTRVVPKAAERSTYLLFSCAALLLLLWKWQPMGGVIWNAESATSRIALYSLYATGWATVLFSTFLLNHFDLFGLRQIWFNLIGRAPTPLAFRTPVLYRHVRHPLYVGWLLVFWSAPLITVAHLVFAIATTAYILIAIQFEERDLVRAHAEYAEYRERVPMLLPIGGLKRGERVEVRQASARQVS